jgi:hypothetical protein
LNVIQETILAEMRAAQLDLAARAKFTKDGDSVYESRSVLDDMLTVTVLDPILASGKLQGMVDEGWVEVDA